MRTVATDVGVSVCLYVGHTDIPCKRRNRSRCHLGLNRAGPMNHSLHLYWLLALASLSSSENESKLSCWGAHEQFVRWRKEKGKEAYLYCAFLYTIYISKRSGMDHTVLPANTPCLPFLRMRSPDGATSNWGKRHLIAAYYSSVDSEGMKGWVGLVGWPIADGLPT